MGRKGSGVEIHGTAIRLSFTVEGKRHRELLMLNRQPMPVTAANMKYAHRVALEIRERIKHGSRIFPRKWVGWHTDSRRLAEHLARCTKR